MKALVMGGTEFVSSSLAKYLILTGYTVDIFTRGVKTIQYEGIRKHLKGDRKSLEDLKKNIASEDYDCVFDISAYTREDVEKVTTILNKGSLKRYVFCSSGGVYTASNNIITEAFTRGENKNWGAYGLDKKNAEDYLFSLYEKENFPVTIFRPTYIYGEGNNLYRESYFFDRILNGLEIPIPEGNIKTQFIYIEDLVKTMESAVHIDRSIGQAYNITHPGIVTWEELLESIMKVVNREVKIRKVNSEKTDIQSREYFPFRNVTYLLDIEKLKEHKLYLPQIDLLQGIERAYNWYRITKPELKDIRMNKVELVLGLNNI